MIRSHFILCFVQLAAAAALVALEGTASGQEAPLDRVLPKAALIDRDQSAATRLLEAKLLANGQANWVERNEIDRILQEQELASAFGAQGGPQRLALGKLLKADVLVLVRSIPSNDKEVPPSIECVVCETRRGLRLQLAAVPADGKDEAIAAALEAAVQRGLARQADKITGIVAVPPLVSDDLGFEHNHLQSAYAKLIEQVLLETPGLVVVELAEAQAIAQELLLAGPAAPVDRGNLPLYLLGRFRHAGAGDKQTVSLELRFVRGEQELARFEKRELTPADAPAWLRKQTLASLPNASLTPPESADSATEARLLAARGNEFLRIGNANEALPLFEASLLLQPDQPQVHRDAARACERLMRVVPVADLFNEKPLEGALGHFVRGLTHLESYLRTAGPWWELQRGGAIDITTTFPQPGVRLIASRNDSRACATLREQARDEATQSYLRIARFRTERGFLEPAWLNYALLPLEENRRIEVAVTAIEETADLPHLEPRIRSINFGGYGLLRSNAGAAVVARLLESKSDKVRKCALAIKKEMEAAAPIAPAPAPVEAGPEVKELSFEPVELTIDRPSKIPLLWQMPRKGIAAGPDFDLLWPEKHTLLRLLPGHRLEKFWAFEDYNFWFTSVVSDGRYVWITGTHRGCLLSAIDIKSGREVRFSADDGLPLNAMSGGDPNLRDALRVVALEPGKVCVIGLIGRTFLATASVATDGSKEFHIFHEAREVPDPALAAQGASTTVTFEPGFAVLLQGAGHSSSKPERRVLVSRKSPNQRVQERPLLVDPDRRTVQVAPFERWLHTDERHCLPTRQGLLFYEHTDKGPALAQLAYPGTEKVKVLDPAPEGYLLSRGDTIHLVGRKWWTLDPKSKAARVLASPVPWHYQEVYHYPGREKLPPYTPQAEDRHLQFVASSNGGVLVVLATGNNREQTNYLLVNDAQGSPGTGGTGVPR